MTGDDPFTANSGTPTSEFNVALATAFYISNLNVGINRCIWENNLNMAAEMLSTLSCQIEGYYLSKRPSKEHKEIIAKLKKYETKTKTIINSAGANKEIILKNHIKDWRNEITVYANVIWLSQEKTNIYGDDYD